MRIFSVARARFNEVHVSFPNDRLKGHKLNFIDDKEAFENRVPGGSD